ncbi:MAG: hypothetical protein ACI3W5_16430 [Faecousia sp.]
MDRELQTLNGDNVKARCRENDICEQTYDKWQRRVFEMEALII